MMKKKLIAFVSLWVFLFFGCRQDFLENTGAPPALPAIWKKSGNTVTPVQDDVGVKLKRYTVAALPTFTADDAGALVQVTDGDSVSDCTTGGGSDTVTCRWTGSAWTNAGDGTAAGSAEVQDEVFNATNFDGDTTHGLSQDDFYDLWHGIDTDDDGDIDAIDATVWATKLSVADIDDTPVDSETAAPISSNWAYDHVAAADPHTGYMLESGTDNVNDTHIDWGTGANQVSGGDMPLDVTNFDGNLSGSDTTVQAAMETIDELSSASDSYTVRVDAGATAGYIGAAYNDGVIRSDGTVVTIADGGDYITLGAHAYLQDIANVTPSQGDILYFNGTDWVVLVAGIAGQFLMTGGAAANPSWDDPAGSGDVTAVGDSASGASFTADGTGNTLYFEGTTANTYEIALTGRNPGADVSVYIPAEDGDLVVGPQGFGTDNLLTKTNGTGNLLQATGISVDDSNNLTGVGSVAGSGALTIGGGSETVAIDSSDWDIDATGVMTGIGNITSDGVVTATGVTIGAAAITEAELEIIDGATLSTSDINIIDGISDSGTLTAGELLYVDGVSSAIQTQLDARCLESVFGTALEADDLALNGTTLELAAEVPHIDAAASISADWTWTDMTALIMGTAGEYVNIEWDTDVSDNDGDFTSALTGEGLVFTLNGSTADSKVIFNNSDATYGVDLYVKDIYYSGSLTYDGSGDSYIELSNNTSLAGSGYMLFYEGGDLVSTEGGTEKTVLNATDGATLTGASWDFSGVTNFEIPNGNSATADAEGEIAIDTDDDQFQMYVGGVQIVMDFTDDASGYVLKSNGSGVLTMQADATAGSPTIDTVGNAAGDATITFDAGEEMSWQFTGAYTTGTQFLVQQQTGNPTGGVLFEARGADADSTVARFGDGTNVWNVSTAGQLANSGTATINFAAASDILVGGGQIDAQDLADVDAGDIVWSSGSVTLDADVVSTDEVADADFGDWSCASGSCTMDADTIAADEMADADHGDVAWASGVATVQAVSGANAVDSDAYVDGSIDAEHLASNAVYTATATKSAAYTVGTDDAKECYGGVIYVTSAATITACDNLASGMSFSVVTIGAIAVNADVQSDDRMYLDGVALDDGDQATNTSTTGDMIVCTYESASGWYCVSGSPDGDHWTDGS